MTNRSKTQYITYKILEKFSVIIYQKRYSVPFSLFNVFSVIQSDSYDEK